MSDPLQTVREALRSLGFNPPVTGAEDHHDEVSLPDLSRLWTGPECGFLSAVRSVLSAEPVSSAPAADDGTTAGVTPRPELAHLLALLTGQFEPEAAAAAEWLRTRRANGAAWVATAGSCNSLWGELAGRLERGGTRVDRWSPFLAGWLVPQSSEVREWQLVQFAMLAAGFSFAADAARRLADWSDPVISRAALPDGFAAAASSAMRCLTVAVPWGDAVPAVNDTIPYPLPDNPRRQRSLIALRALLRDQTGNVSNEFLDGVTVPAWLTVRRLIGWMLNDDESQAGPPAKTARRGTASARAADGEAVVLLFVDGANREHSGLLNVAEYSEFLTGSYLDPLQTGILLLDADFVESLAVAAEIASGALADRCSTGPRETSTQPGIGSVVSQRLHLTLPPQFHLIDGGSAGGLLGLSLYAVAKGEPLNPRISGSFCLRRRDANKRIVVESDILIKPVDQSSICPKITAASKAAPHRADLVLLHGDNIAKDATVHAAERHVELLRVESFAGAFAAFTKNAELNAILRPLNAAIVEAWEGRRTDGLAAGARSEFLRRPKPYIEPHLGRLLPEAEAIEISEVQDRRRVAREKEDLNRASRYEWLTPDENARDALTAETEHSVMRSELLQMLQTDPPNPGSSENAAHKTNGAAPAPRSLRRRLAIAEDANAGKTILSKRMAAFFAEPETWIDLFDGQPPLVVRWENGPEEASMPWPSTVDELRHRLKELIRLQPLSSIWTPDEALEELLRQGRVVLILDSVDQADGRERLLTDLIRETDFDQCLVIVTGRLFAFREEQSQHRFRREVWSFFTIMGFTENQQHRFLSEVMAPDQTLRDLFADYDSILELLGVAGMLAMILEILRDERDRMIRLQDGSTGSVTPVQSTTPIPAVRLERLKTRGDFYNEFYQRQMKRAAEKNRTLNLAEHEDRWQLMLSVSAFLMVLERATNYTVSGEVLIRVQAGVRRYADGLARLTKNPQLRICEGDWERLRGFSPLSDHSILERATGRVLSFRHKGWMEFFAGRFLAKYAEPKCLALLADDLPRHVIKREDACWPGFICIEPRRIQRNAREEVRDEVQSTARRMQKSTLKNRSERRYRELLFDAVLLQITNDPQWYWMWRFAIEMPRYIPKGELTPKGPFVGTRLGRTLSCLFQQPIRELRPNELACRAMYLFEHTLHTPVTLRSFSTALPDHIKRNTMTRFRNGSDTAKAALIQSDSFGLRPVSVKIYSLFDPAFPHTRTTAGWLGPIRNLLPTDPDASVNCVTAYDACIFGLWLTHDYALPTVTGDDFYVQFSRLPGTNSKREPSPAFWAYKTHEIDATSDAFSIPLPIYTPMHSGDASTPIVESYNLRLPHLGIYLTLEKPYNVN